MLDTIGGLPGGAAVPQHRGDEERGRRLFRQAVTGAIVLGFLVRAAHVLSKDFPLNDGGLFYAMVRDLQASRYLLPALTSYNAADIPFGYSPLGFYVAGLLEQLTPLGLLDVFRFLPLAVNGLIVIAFFLLARAMLPSRVAVVAAVVAFALIPRSFVWLIMGGGITRSFGFLFALLALHQAYLLYTRREARFVPTATLCAGLTVLSHLETGWFLAYSLALFFFAFGRSRHGLASSAAIAAGTVLITAPWWGTVIAHHGIAPFIAAGRTGGSLFSDGETRAHILLSLARFVSTSEPFFPLLGTLALLGALASVVTRRFVLPAWWVTIVLLDARAFPTFTTLPVALLAGVGIAEVLLPVLRRPPAPAQQDVQPPVPVEPAGRARLWPRALVLGFFLCYATAGALISKAGLAGEGSFLVSLSRDERAAMRWVARETPPESRFLIVPDTGWATAKTSEWFPVLAERVSVATVQGQEWLPGGAFARRVHAYEQAWECGYRVAACLDTWSEETGITFTHVYIARSPAGQCCTTLVASLGEDPRYELVYDGPGATIYARRGQDPAVSWLPGRSPLPQPRPPVLIGE